MYAEAPTIGIAHQVVVYTQVNGLVDVARADHDLRVVDRTHEARRRFPEQGNRSDMVG
jgi:hypothetical protein